MIYLTLGPFHERTVCYELVQITMYNVTVLLLPNYEYPMKSRPFLALCKFSNVHEFELDVS